MIAPTMVIAPILEDLSSAPVSLASVVMEKCVMVRNMCKFSFWEVN